MDGPEGGSGASDAVAVSADGAHLAARSKLVPRRRAEAGWTGATTPGVLEVLLKPPPNDAPGRVSPHRTGRISLSIHCVELCREGQGQRVSADPLMGPSRWAAAPY